MLYNILTDYTINDDTSIYTILNLENTTVEITMVKSVASDSVFIEIKENGDVIVSDKTCTAFEYIYDSACVKRFSSLSGDFYFSYTTEEAFNNNFDYRQLGEKLFLFYDDMKE